MQSVAPMLGVTCLLMCWQRSVLALLGGDQCFGNHHRIISFLWFAPAFSVCLNAQILLSLPMFDERNTQVDASNQRHSF